MKKEKKSERKKPHDAIPCKEVTFMPLVVTSPWANHACVDRDIIYILLLL